MNHTLFHMWDPFRKCIIDRHKFYVEQSQGRLLSQFVNIEKEADRYGKEWLENCSQCFNPEIHDPGDFYEQAYEESINFYQMLDEMYNQTRLSVVAGMFHEWDKQLRSWVLKEINNWHRGDELKKAIWRRNFNDTIDLFEGFGWLIRSKDYYISLNRCRLVVNVYKHGDGNSLEEIRKLFPDFLIGLESNDLSF